MVRGGYMFLLMAVAHGRIKIWAFLPQVGVQVMTHPLCFAADGTGYLMYGGFGNRATASPENGVFIARTTDEGVTWQSHFAVIRHTGPQTPDSNFEDKYYVHVDNSPTSPVFRQSLYSVETSDRSRFFHTNCEYVFNR
jgi:hypothetical protein